MHVNPFIIRIIPLELDRYHFLLTKELNIRTMPTIATATPSKMPQTSKNGEIPNRPSNHHPRMAPPLILTATNHPMIERRARTGTTELRPLASRSEPIRSPDSTREDRSSFSRSPFRIWTFVPSSTLNYKQHYTRLITLIQKLLQKPIPKHSLTSPPIHRHCGLDPQSRGAEGRMGNATLSTCWIRPWRKLVLASRQYPQRGAPPSVIPSKARNLGSRNRHAGLAPVSIEQCTTPSCHCGLDPQSRGVVLGGRHTGFKAVSTARGTTQCHSEQSEESRQSEPSCWTCPGIHRTMHNTVLSLRT